MIKGFSITQVLAASGVELSPSNVWNSAGTTFTGIKFNVTDTASAAGSLLMDLQVGGSSRFSVRKDGLITVPSNGGLFSPGNISITSTYTGYVAIGNTATATIVLFRTTAAANFATFNNTALVGFNSNIVNPPTAYFSQAGTDIIGVTNSLEFTESTAPAAPAANKVRIYAEDNGSGKTRLMAIFASGAAQQIAIEP